MTDYTKDMEVIEAATDGPWVETEQSRVCKTEDDSCVCCLALMGNTDDDGEWDDETLDRWYKDAQYIARALKAEAKLEHLSHRLYCPSCNDFIVPFEKKDNSAIFCDAMNLLEKLGAKYYIKNDLRKHMEEK